MKKINYKIYSKVTSSKIIKWKKNREILNLRQINNVINYKKKTIIYDI